jgi:hypothetical protein
MREREWDDSQKTKAYLSLVCYHLRECQETEENVGSNVTGVRLTRNIFKVFDKNCLYFCLFKKNQFLKFYINLLFNLAIPPPCHDQHNQPYTKKTFVNGNEFN